MSEREVENAVSTIANRKANGETGNRGIDEARRFPVFLDFTRGRWKNSRHFSHNRPFPRGVQ
jgi:hypothetical protein